MRPHAFLACFQVGTRKLLHGLVSALVIGSMLLQPVTAIAVIHQPERAKVVDAASTGSNADENSGLNNRSAPEEMSATDRTRTAATLSKPAKRTLAQVSPTPSNARPVYPYNHILDSSMVAVGSPSINHNFEAPPVAGGAPPYNHDFQLSAMGGGTLPLNHDLQTPVTSSGPPPTNYDFSTASYAVGAALTNYNFATATLVGWTATSPSSTIIQTDPVYGAWAQVQSGSLTSDPFIVDSSAQRITFATYRPTSGAATVYLHVGGIRKNIGTLPTSCNPACNWVTYSISMVGYVGQSVRIEFQRTSGFVGFDDIRVEVLLPGYDTDGDVSRIGENNGNAYARLSDNNLNSRGVITTAAFLVGNEAQRLTLSMIGLSATTTNQYQIQVLHGPGYSETKSFPGSIGNSWQELSYAITEWQGQWVKLRIVSRLSGSIGVDNIGIQSIILPNYKLSGTVERGEESNGNVYARLAGDSTITTTAFAIGNGVHELKLSLNGLTATTDQYRVHLLSAATGALLHQLEPGRSANDGWQQMSYLVSNWQGQSVKLRIISINGAVGVDNIGLQTMTLAGYTTAGPVTQVAEAAGNQYARMAGGGVLTTPAFTIGSAAQQLTLSVIGLTPSVDNYIVQALSGPGYSTVTTLAPGTEAVDSWQPVTLNVRSLQGQSVKLRFTTPTSFDVVGLDNIGVQATPLPGWTIEGDAMLVDEGNGNHYVSTTGVLTSSLITLGSNLQQIALRYRGVGSNVIDRFSVTLLRSATGEAIDLTGLVVATTSWQTLKIGLNKYAGETVRLRLEKHYGRVHFDDVGEGESILPGWQITTFDGIATDADSYGSYVTAAQGDFFMIHSDLIGLGLIDRPNRVDARYYSIAYDLTAGGTLLQVFWRNEQGQDYTVFQTSSHTPTGYQESYFSVHEGLGTAGRFYIKFAGAGKVYSIADNIARQQLAEPFAYKVGGKIDTSTGSFGYSALDLQMDELFPLVFTRYYNGHSDRPGVLGHGWSHSYETRLVIDEQRDHAGVVFGSGKEVFYLYNRFANTYTPADVRIQDRLSKNSDGTYTFVMKGAPPAPYSTDNQCSDVAWHQVQLCPQNLQYHFAADGKLTSIRDSNGVAVTLNYVNHQLASVVSQSGAAFTLTYNASGQVETVQSSWAGTATYGYEDTDLISVTRDDQGTETYSYSDHKLSRIMDANNNTLIHNTFDAFHRVTAQADAHNDVFTVEYNTPAPGVTAVRYPDNKTHHFYYDHYQRTTDWVAPTGEVTSYLYDGVGNLQKVIDSGQGEWNFSYDESANLLGLADPQGDPLLISYSPEYLPTSITDGNGNVTTIQYYADGKIEKITTGGEETAYTYTPLGQVATVISPWRQERYTYHPLDGTIQAGKLATRSLGPAGAEKSWVYTYERFVHEGLVMGRKEHVTDPNGHTATTIYNRANRIVALRDHTGAQKKFLYDPVGHLLMAEDELGRRTYWDYNAVGLVEKKTDPEGFNTFYTYDANRNMTTMTDPNGLVTSYEYDGSNRLKKTTLPGNRVTEYWYDGCGRVTDQQNPRGQVTSYDYDLGGQLITMTMPLNAVYGFQYDGNGNLKKAIDPLRYVTEKSYDALNRPLTIKDGAGFTTEYQYDPTNREIRTINPRGETTTYRYNLLGQMTAMVNPLQQTTTFAYDGVGNRTAITDTLGYVERFAYDPVDRPEYYKNKAGRITQFVYDAAGQLKQIIEPTTQATRVTHFDYWDRGMLKSVTNALAQPPTQYLYDAGGRLTNIWEPDGRGTKYHYYPDNGLLEKVLDRVDKATRYEYDPMGNVTAVIDPLGRRATYEYDELNRLKKAAAPNSLPTEYKYYANGKLKELWTSAQRPTYYAYDGRGLVTSVTDAFGRAMNYTYDEVGRLKTVTDRRQVTPYVLEYLYDSGGRLTDMRGAAVFNNVGVHYDYDGANRLAAVTDPNGLTTSYTYNALGQVRTETQPISRTTTYTYDEYNRLWVTEDPRGVEVTYSYDALDRVKQVAYPGGQNTFEYDILGRLDWYSDPTGVTNYGYDDASRVNQIVTPQGAIAYDYHDDGQRKWMTLDAGAPDARTINYGYNDKGQLATITDWQGRANSLSYDADGNLAGMARYNNVNTAYTYDVAGRLDRRHHNGPAGPLAWFDYTLDEMGNRTALDSSSGHEAYGIDQLNRLYSAGQGYGSESYQYHPNGDRMNAGNGTDNYYYNATGQLESRNTLTLADSGFFAYDENGNTTTFTDAANQTDSYTWDWANRLTSATVNGQTVNYAYDAMGVRVSATISGTTQNLLWDRMAELPLLVDDGNQSYLHGAGPLAQIDAAGTRYDLLADGLGSVRKLIDGTGAVVGAADYTMFGEYRNQTGVTSRFGFTGEYYAQETGMWHLRARDLHPSLGRFLSADPVQPNAPGTQGYNRYAYVANNPTTWVDPSGYTAEPAMGDSALFGMMLAMQDNLVEVFLCALSVECRMANVLIDQLGSQGLNLITWTAEELQQALFSTYPHQPTPVDPGMLVLSIGLSNTPIIGDLYDLYTGVTGYDPITGQYLAGWERLTNIVGGLILLPGVTGSNVRHGVHAVESLIDSGDELAQFIGAAGKCRRNSFSEETPVATDEGAVPIGEIDVGDRVLAWNEFTDTTGYYTVSATFSHVDATIVELTIAGETLETTADHPFYVVADAPWLAVGETQGRWIEAGNLQVGDAVLQADGTTGAVAAMKVVAQPQRMYNLTVANAHTFFVGDGEWLVHNCGSIVTGTYKELRSAGLILLRDTN